MTVHRNLYGGIFCVQVKFFDERGLRKVGRSSINLMQLARKVLRLLREHGPAFVLRRAIWRLHFERLHRLMNRRAGRGERAPSVIRFLDKKFELASVGQGN